MEGSSFVNAFRVLARKPMLFLLLLPLQLALPLVSLLLPAPAPVYDMMENLDAFGTFGNSLSHTFSLLGIYFLLYLLAGIFLVPPAMELLHDGAQGTGTPSGWYARGISKHWWKPVTFGAMECTLFGILTMIFSFFLSFLAIFSVIGSIASEYNDTGDSATAGITLTIWVLIGIFALVILFLYCIFAMLLPATADRGFGAAFKAVFNGRGFKRLMKIYGVYILTIIVSAVIYLAFAFIYGFASSRLIYQYEWDLVLSNFTDSWMFYIASAVISLVMLFRYSYIFCVFQEIKNAEKAAMPAGPAATGAGENDGTACV